MPDARYKGRCIPLVCSTVAQAEKYTKLAKKAQVPRSKFLLEVIEASLAERSVNSKAKLSEKYKSLREENSRLKEELRIMTLLAEKAEKEVQQLQQAAFLENGFQGQRNINMEIVAVLRRGATHDYQLLEALGIGPQDTELIRAVQSQMGVLELHGLVVKERRGWRWKGK